MRKFFLILFVACLSLGVSAQGNFEVKQTQQAHYPGGEYALQEYFNLNMVYTKEALDNRVYGDIMLSFDVKADSSVTDIVILDGVGYGLDEIVVTMLYKLKFAPAISNGVVIRSNMIISVNVKAIPRPTLEIEK